MSDFKGWRQMPILHRSGMGRGNKRRVTGERRSFVPSP